MSIERLSFQAKKIFSKLCLFYLYFRFEAQTFNFYCFPRPFEDWQPQFISQASSLDFLAQCNFDFNKWIHDGISYLPLSLRAAKLRDFQRRLERPDIPLTLQEDVEFVKRLVEQVTKWLRDTNSNTLILESRNSYQRALQYQALRKDQFGALPPPGFCIEKVQDANGRPAICLRKASKEESDAWELKQQQQRMDDIEEATGLSNVLLLMRDCNKPAVGHNLAFDLAYILNSFARSIPLDWSDYKNLVQEWFPGGIFDTKHMAKQLPEGHLDDTSLGYLYKSFMSDSQLWSAVAAVMHSTADTRNFEHLMPSIVHAEGYQRYVDAQENPLYAHEAGFDAFMTGAVFAKLCSLFKLEQIALPSATQEKNLLGLDDERNTLDRKPSEVDISLVSYARKFCWRVNLTNSDLEYIEMRGPDVLPERGHIVFVCSLPAAQVNRYSDVLKALNDVDSSLQSIKISEIGDWRRKVEDGVGSLEALVEFSSEDIAVGRGTEALQSAFPSCSIHPFSKFRSRRENERSTLLESRRRLKAGTKRPRVVLEAHSPNLTDKKAPMYTRSCSIM